MTLCGWMTTSIAPGGTPNSQCASITSRPLFIIVAESTLILRPITQLGCAQASSGVTPREFRRAARSRNGPPDAVSRIRRTPAAARLAGDSPAAGTGRSRCARCRSGSSVAPPSPTAAMNAAPPMTSASLLASRMRLPARAAASVGAQAGGADDGRQHGVGLRQRRDGAHARLAAEHPGWQSAAGERALEQRGRLGVEQRRQLRADAAGTARQACRHCRARPAPPRQSGRVAGDDVERRVADRSGRAQQRHLPPRPGRRIRRMRPAGDLASGRSTCSSSNTAAASAAAGMAASSASMRSSTPPWPGSSAPLSLTPAWRFSSDSNRSPPTDSAASSERDRDPEGDVSAAVGAPRPRRALRAQRQRQAA